MLSICRELLSNRRQRVLVDGGTSEWILIASDVPQGSVLGPLLFILYISEMFELVKNRLYAYADDSTLVAVVHKPVDTGTWLGFRSGANTGAWYWILTKPSLCWLVNPELWIIPVVTWSYRSLLFEIVPTSTFLAWSLTAGSPSETMCVVLSKKIKCIKQRFRENIGEKNFAKVQFSWNSVQV